MLREYQSHRVVQAAKISKIEKLPDGSALLSFGSPERLAEESLSTTGFAVGAQYMEKHAPEVGGYLVRYADGYISWSPADAFEGGYTEIVEEERKCSVPEHSIGWAIEELRQGRRVGRGGWNGPHQFLTLQVPDAHSKMTLPYIYIRTVDGDLVPWLASQTDILACDWRVVW